MPEPHPAALTPEQRAEAIFGRHRSPLLNNLVRDIAASIRSAVMAEREECAKAAEMRLAMSCFVTVNDCATYNQARRDAAEAIRARSTETAHAL